MVISRLLCNWELETDAKKKSEMFKIIPKFSTNNLLLFVQWQLHQMHKCMLKLVLFYSFINVSSLCVVDP